MRACQNLKRPPEGTCMTQLLSLKYLGLDWLRPYTICVTLILFRVHKAEESNPWLQLSLLVAECPRLNAVLTPLLSFRQGCHQSADRALMGTFLGGHRQKTWHRAALGLNHLFQRLALSSGKCTCGFKPFCFLLCSSTVHSSIEKGRGGGKPAVHAEIDPLWTLLS